MRITLDTNVLVSAFISKQGHSAKLVDIMLTFPEIRLVLSEPILLEFKDVMLRREVRDRFHYSAKEIESFVKELRRVARMINVRSEFDVVNEDPKDNIVINTAFDGGSDFIASGDSHLQRTKKFRGIRIASPKQLIGIIEKRFGELVTSTG